MTTTLFLLLSIAAAPGADDLVAQARTAARAGKTEDAIALATKAIAADPKNTLAVALRASLHETAERWDAAYADLTRLSEADPKDAGLFQRRGVVQFKRGNIDGSIRDFDRYIELKPAAKVSHWQRGISYYYAGRYEEGKKQFEGYQDYDANDVENAIWRFMCMAHKDGVKQAQKAMLKIGDDKRVPMRQVYDLFKGDLRPQDVLAAARTGKPSAEQLNSRLFYAHLYVGIWYDLLGDRKLALANLEQAVGHRIGHYMWDVARIHAARLRVNGSAGR